MKTLTEANNGETIHVSVGEEFEIELVETPSAGYRWVQTIECSCINRKDEAYTTGAVRWHAGASGIHHWVFTPVFPGNGMVKFAYKRAWEGKVAKEFTVNITVN